MFVWTINSKFLQILKCDAVFETDILKHKFYEKRTQLFITIITYLKKN
jgi:hypothetical protein